MARDYGRGDAARQRGGVSRGGRIALPDRDPFLIIKLRGLPREALLDSLRALSGE
jgi:hypothetical protein